MATPIFRKNLLFRFLFLTVFILIFACNSDDPVLTDDDVGQEPDDPIALQDKLPQFMVDTQGGTIVDEPKISSQTTITVAGDVVYEGNMGIEFRGASSQALFPKKSYGLETWNENGEDIDVSLLGFPEEEDWILYGPYSDKSLLRNILIYDLSRDIDRYASRCLFVDINYTFVFERSIHHGVTIEKHHVILGHFETIGRQNTLYVVTSVERHI